MIGSWYLEEDADPGLDACTDEPQFHCWYRDKPSKYPCKDSPPIDKGGRSFW